MTDVMPEQTTDAEQETGGWGEDSAVHYPEMPSNPHNHRYTISMNGQGPMVVVRGNTAEEVNAAWQELEAQATGAIMGNAWAAIKAAAMVANGLGATPVPAGPVTYTPAPGQQAQPAPPPFGPNVSVPGAPGFQGNPGFPPPQAAPPAQGQWGGQQQGPRDNSPEFQQNGWYALTVPFPVGKKQFDGICAQYQMKKGRPAEGGVFSFNGTNKTWYVAPSVAGAFPMFNPVPA